MAKSAGAPGVEVTFVTRDGGVTIRMMDNSFNAVCEAARHIQASHVVLLDEWHVGFGLPTWAVYDMSKAQKDTPMRTWTLPVPSKLITAAKNDGAVMWAVMHRSTK